MPNLEAPPLLERPASLRLFQHIRPVPHEPRWKFTMLLVVLVELASPQL